MAKPIESGRRPALSGWPMILGWLAMIIFALHTCTHMVAAGDTWVALACGRHFINHGVDTVEPFSANSHKAGPTWEEIATWPPWAQSIASKVGLETVRYWHPTGWVNQNWLTHVIFYWLTYLSPFADAKDFSFNTLVYWKFAIYIITVICVYYTGRVLGANPALCAVFACFAMFVGRSLIDIRPAGFSNLLAPVFLLILVLAVRRSILYIWLIVPLAVFWCNVHGGYIYLFIMLVPFVALNLLTTIFRKRFVSIGLKGVYHAIGAGFAAFVAVIIFNPFHLTNLTHTFVISVSKHAEYWRSVNEWHPAFEWSNPVGDEIPFLIMYIIAWLLLVLWAGVLIATWRSVRNFSKRRANVSDSYQWPQVDLALMVIAALTIYMAIRSRRFIPIAANVACPVLAMFIDQIICAISATRNFRGQNRLAVPPMPRRLQVFFSIIAAGAVLTFGTWWGLKFKQVFLDPWPNDPKFTSVFMRMTASDAKPFYACRFIRENKMEGRMFNYWTEGGFIAWGQEPNPNTGQTPLKLFMDGRAQAAYEPKVYQIWANIMAGGIITAELRQNAAARGRELTIAEYEKIGQWISEELKKYDVWVVLMPAAEFNTDFVKAIERSPNWYPILFNDKERLYIDVTTAKGKELFAGVFDGKTVYPDEFHKNLVICNSLLGDANTAKEGLGFAIKSFELNPSQTAMRKILLASRFPELRRSIYDFCKKYFDDFVERKGSYAKQDGYSYRLLSAWMTCGYLGQTAETQKNVNVKLMEFYDAKRREFLDEQIKAGNLQRW